VRDRADPVTGPVRSHPRLPSSRYRHRGWHPVPPGIDAAYDCSSVQRRRGLPVVACT
jgi:hypothetical protein